MTTLDAMEARTRLHSLIDEAAQTHRPIMITSKRGNAVLLAEEDWNTINAVIGSTANPWRESE